jgi:hypothetical protein
MNVGIFGKKLPEDWQPATVPKFLTVYFSALAKSLRQNTFSKSVTLEESGNTFIQSQGCFF